MKQSPSVERNKKPILDILAKYIIADTRLLEIGSGTGEHAVHFGAHFPKLHWVTSETKDKHRTIKQRLKDAKLKNVHGPETLKVGVDDFPKGIFDYVFMANILHIMSWKEDKTLFRLLGKRLREASLVFMYGPFNFEDKFTSKSNEEFDAFLRERDNKSGIRGFEAVAQNMQKCGFKLLKDHEMPTNNRLLVFERLLHIKEKK